MLLDEYKNFAKWEEGFQGSVGAERRHKRQALCPHSVPSWLSVTDFSGTPSVKYLVLLSLPVHTFTSLMKSFVWSCVSIFAFENIIMATNRQFELVQNGSAPPPLSLSHTSDTSSLFHFAEVNFPWVFSALGFGVWVSLAWKYDLRGQNLSGGISRSVVSCWFLVAATGKGKTTCTSWEPRLPWLPLGIWHLTGFYLACSVFVQF